MSQESLKILRDASRLANSEDRVAATLKLKKVPEAKLVSTFNEALDTGDTWTDIVAQASASLELKSMVPKLLETAEKKENWYVFAALGQLADTAQRPLVEAIYSKNLTQLESEQKMLVLDQMAVWKTKIPFE
ncbi:MAG: hypothetical protein V4692_05465, partial [Bdellovibrionota bacterium]